MTPAADMRAAAAAAGRKYETFRKTWPRWVRTQGFPAPFTDAPYQWDAERLEAWRVARSDARRHAIVAAPAANDDHTDHDAPPSPVRKGRVAAGRARIMQRMQG